MGYISAQQAATKWGISKRRVQVLCTENRIKNATRIGNMWVVPEDALKPADGRVQTHHTVESPTARAARTALKKLTVNAYQEINGKLNNPSTSKMVFVSLLATTIFCDIQNDESSNEKDDVFLMISSELLEIEFKESSRRSFWEMFSSLVSDFEKYIYRYADYVDFSAQITYRALESYMDRKRRRAIDSDSFACCNEYENITFLDYSCGCGEFLLAVIQYFDNHVLGYSRKKLATQLRGVDVNPIALMITIARIVSAVEAEDDENLLREVAKNFIFAAVRVNITHTFVEGDGMDEFRDYVREHRIQFEEECPQPCLDALWWYYGEYHALGSPHGKVSKNSGISWNRSDQEQRCGDWRGWVPVCRV